MNIRENSKTKLKIVCVDFDGTLFSHPGSDFPKVGYLANKTLINLLIKYRNENKIKVILWTCREGNNLDLAVETCKKFGLEFDAVNDNLPEIIERFGYNSRKPYCSLFIDDRNLNVTDMDALHKFLLD